MALAGLYRLCLFLFVSFHANYWTQPPKEQKGCKVASARGDQGDGSLFMLISAHARMLIIISGMFVIIRRN